MNSTPEPVNLAGLLPDLVDGWTPAEADGVYTADTLFDYINGGAEVYRAFNVQQVVGRRYAKPGAPDIIADIYDMGSAADAYGAYHHDVREGASAGVGQESEMMTNAVYFWKDRFFVNIIGMRQDAETVAAVRSLAAAVAERIPGEGVPPELVAALPEQGRIESQVHFFHHPLCLKTHYYLAEDNVLNLGPTVDAALARYRTGGEPYVVLIVQYGDAAAAEDAFEQFSALYLPDADADGAAKLENGLWSGAQRRGINIMAVFDAPDKQTVASTLAGVQERLSSSRR